jgi:hypothetical protein
MARTRADIANTALRIFLQEMGAAYDLERGFQPFQPKDFAMVRAFFDERCCYCYAALTPKQVNQDRLNPMNKNSLGLHAWGNIVPACQDCNREKQGTSWRDFLIRRARAEAVDRHAKVSEFIALYRYDPDTTKLRTFAEELYEEADAVAMALIETKVRRLRSHLSTA